jgi:hypothetical protein
VELYLYFPLYAFIAFTDSFTFTFMDKERRVNITWNFKTEHEGSGKY